MIAGCAEIVGAFFALAAAVLWFVSAVVKTPREFCVKVISIHVASSDIDGSEVVSEGFGTSDELTDLGNALIKQSHLSAWAAALAAISALCQGFAVLWTRLVSN